MGFFGTGKGIFRTSVKVEPPAIDPATTGNSGLSQDIEAALVAANAPEEGNPFATIDDIVIGPAIFNCVSDGTTGLIISYGSNIFERFGYNLPSTSKVSTGIFKVDASGFETPFANAFAFANPSADTVGISVDCIVMDSTKIQISFFESSTGNAIDPVSFVVAVFMWA